MKKSLLIIMGYLLIFTIATFTKERELRPIDDINGFRGIKWGTNISELENMKFVRKSDVSELEDLEFMDIRKPEKVKVYTKKNDSLKLANAELEKIEYYFLDGKFAWVLITSKKMFAETNYNYLRDSCDWAFGIADGDYIEGRYVIRAKKIEVKPKIWEAIAPVDLSTEKRRIYWKGEKATGAWLDKITNNKTMSTIGKLGIYSTKVYKKITSQARQEKIKNFGF